MPKPKIANVLTGIVACAVLLPVAITLVLATGFLFAGLQDMAAARLLNGFGLGLGLLWLIDLVGLVLLLGFEAAGRAEAEREDHVDEE
ncbi:MAG TPA: hypothetical protein VHC22_28710 [Pirellulales bacterium]|nr:hypothetical protein [Pirellulales bacterium]